MRSSRGVPRSPARWLVLAGTAVFVAGCGFTETFPRKTPPATASPVSIPPEMWVTNPSGPVITPDQASTLVRAFWPVRSKALADDDARTIAALETGPAAEHDLALTTDDIARPHLPNTRQVAPLVGLFALVPHKTSYPAIFMAEAQTTVYGTSSASSPGTSFVEILVFTRPDSGTPWRLTLDSGFVGTRQSLIPANYPGFGYNEPPASRLAVDPPTVPGLYAAYRQHIDDTGSLPADSVFGPGFWTTQEPLRLYEEGQQFRRETGITRQSTFSVDLPRDGLFQFSVSVGTDPAWDLACFVLRYVTVSTPRPGQALVQRTSRDEWGGWLAPGNYSRITTRGSRQACAMIPPAGDLGRVGIIGGFGGILTVTGDPAG